MYARCALLLISLGTACNQEPAPSGLTMPAAPTTKAPAAPAAEKPDAAKTVVDVAVGSPDHTTLVKALQAAGLVDALNSPGGIYTIFAPTNAAFDKLPPGTLDSLMKPEKLEDLKKILKHHAAVPILTMDQIQDGQTLPMSDGSKVTFHKSGDELMVDGAKVLGSVRCMNGIVYVVDSVILPPS